MNRKINAIIMAAGKGERLRPLTLTTPKPLIAINGVPMIENIITSLKQKGINDIVVVTGYLKERFDYLRDKYNITIIYNPDYEIANNISSLYYAREYLKDTIILDGDQIINDINIISNEFNHSGYTCWTIDTFSPEWIIEIDKSKRITKCYRDGYNKGYELKSLSYWNKEDASKLKQLVVEEYITNNRKDVYWDDIAMFLHKDKFDLYGYIINENSIIEIDNMNDLKKMGIIV